MLAGYTDVTDRMLGGRGGGAFALVGTSRMHGGIENARKLVNLKTDREGGGRECGAGGYA